LATNNRVLLPHAQDLELPTDLPLAAGAESAEFSAPTAGPAPAQRWLQKCGLAAEHVAAGDFASAMRLLNRQLGVVAFEPLKPYFLEVGPRAV
jgi:coatomer subunit alpha